MVKSVLMGNDGKLCNYIESVFKTVASYYNYDYIKVLKDELDLKSKLLDIKKEQDKVYFVDDTKFGVIAFKNAQEIKAEVISFGYRFLEELGLDVQVKINILEDNKEREFISYLNYLDIDYEINNSKQDYISFNIYEDNSKDILIKGEISEDKIYFVGEFNPLIKLLNKDNKINEDILDVLVKGSSKEEKLVAVPLVQDLRWSEIRCELNGDKKARLLINIKDEDLKKGLISVKDNATGEEELIDEAVIIDYVISNL